MTGQAVSGEALARLRHDLRTPLNHILGYAEMLLEDTEDAAVEEQAGVLRHVHTGGRALLDRIQSALGDSGSAVTTEELTALDGGLRPEAEGLLRHCEQVASRFRECEAKEPLADVERISAAFRRLLELSGRMAGDTAPAAVAAPADLPAPSAVAVARSVRKIGAEEAGRILVVEDNPENRDLLRRRLEREGYLVWEAENGARALEELRVSDFDLLLLDIIMPVMDGFEVLARLKGDPRWRDLPVIMISALDEIQSAVRCIEMGAEELMVKPFYPTLLRARIDATLEKKRLRDRERRKTEELEQALRRLKETQDQLVVQEKMASLGALTAGIAHEIKNPLNFVINFSELSVDLLKELGEILEPVRPLLDAPAAAGLAEVADALTQNLQRIREHGKRADSIVRGMLAHSRGGSGKREAADINALLAETVNLAYHGLRARDPGFNVSIEHDYDAALPVVQAFSEDLTRVFLNIVNNGCYAAHQRKLAEGDGFHPTISVSTRQAGDCVEIRIKDNGAGIPKDALPRIFNPFFTTKPAGSGTGLGLSLSYQIVVERHKGSIRVDTVEGEYTEFAIALPIAPATAP